MLSSSRHAGSLTCRSPEVQSEHHPNGARASVRTYESVGSGGARRGLTLSASSDAAGRTVRIAVEGASFELQRTLDASGRETARAVNTALRVELGRDALGRVETRRVLWQGREVRRTDYAYASGRLAAVRDSKSGALTYDYDPVGNLVAIHPRSGCDVRRGLSVAEDCGSPLYELDRAGRVVQTEWASYEYDRAGRRVRKRDADGGSTRYEWDAAGRLAVVAADGRPTVRYAYDPLGRVRARTVIEETEQGSIERVRTFRWDGPRLVHEEEGDTSVTWLWLEGEVVGCLVGGRVLTFLVDPRGVVTEVVDESGELVFSPEGDPLASAFAPPSHVHQPWCWTGHWFDVDTGLAFSLTRFYDPELSAYLSPHPFGPAAGWNTVGIPSCPVTGRSELGLAAGLHRWYGRAIPRTLDRELAELTLEALGAGMRELDDALAHVLRDPWAQFLRPIAPHLPSTRLREAGPFRVCEPPALMPASEATE